MKKSILIILLISTFSVNAQSIKDLLYGGKLKTDSGTVIRKGDDLSSKIDTSKKKPVETEKTKMAVVSRDSIAGSITQADSVAMPAVAMNDNNVATKDNNAPRDN